MFESVKHLNPKSILLIRSSAKLFPVALDKLKEELPDAEVTILSNGPDVEGLYRVFKTKRSGGFFWKDILDFQESVKLDGFDLAIGLYNSKKGLSYLNIDAYAFAAGAKNVASINIDGEVKLVTLFNIVQKMLHRLIDSLWLVINAVFTTLVLVIMGLIMLIVEPVVRIKRLK